MDQELTPRWELLCRRIGCACAGEVLRRLEVSYTEKLRAYHTLDHIQQCLAEFDAVRSECDDPDAIEAAIWFHDAVYDPKRDDNEERSADLARQMLRDCGAGPSFTDKVYKLILVTKHSEPPATRDGQILADIDLASLAIPPDEFDANTQAIRREFSHVDEDAFAAGRIKFIEALLSRPHIYYTPMFRQRYEAPARANLTRSLARLTAGRER